MTVKVIGEPTPSIPQPHITAMPPLAVEDGTQESLEAKII